jgi:hypothetical protein
MTMIKKLTEKENENLVKGGLRKEAIWQKDKKQLEYS